MKKIVLLLVIFINIVYAAPAREGVKLFHQPDGTLFEGVLRGDSSLHWIESNGKIVINNPEDKFYYNARVSEKGFSLTSEKPQQVQQSALLSKKTPSTHKLDTATVTQLKKYQNSLNTRHRPR